MSPLLEVAPRFLYIPLCFVSLLFYLVERCNFNTQSGLYKIHSQRLFYGVLFIGPLAAIAGALGLTAASLPQDSVHSQRLYIAEQAVLAFTQFSRTCSFNH